MSGSAGETQPLFVDPGARSAAPNPTGVQQDTDAVFSDVEEALKKHDQREQRLALAYRDSQKESKEREKKARERLKHNSLKSDRDTNDDPESCYIEIKNLVLIKNSVIHKTALEEWDREEKLFASRVERKSTKVESRKNEVYQLIGFFSVFQGVVLTAVSQSNLLHCNNRWSPVLLSVLASIVTIGGVFQKLRQISSLEKTIYSENQALKDVVRRGQDLRREGKGFVFSKFSPSWKRKSNEDHSTWYAVVVYIFLLVFTVVFPVSHWRILCDPGHDPYVPPPA